MPAAPRRSPRSGRTRLPDTFVESLSGRGHRASSGGGFTAPGTGTLGSATRSRDVAADSATIRWMPRARMSPTARMRRGSVACSWWWVMEGRSARCLYPCISAVRRRVFRIGGECWWQAGAGMKDLTAPPEGDTARSVVADRSRRDAQVEGQRRRREPARPARPSTAIAPGAGITPPPLPTTKLSKSMLAPASLRNPAAAFHASIR